ncbi:hypothetical protein Q0M94_09580 [Deinococcus radiomollis]|uniref:hypothetical protein n=1 Tax=Deinococcus radiomollis TaxID=468916 RepID=UPI0038912906
MTLDQWLQEATGTFPRGVRERLAQEYGAHLEDSVATGGSEDAFELFGDPTAVRKMLGKSYVDEQRLKALRNQREWIFWLIGGTVICFHFYLFTSRPTITSALTIVTVVSVLMTVWFISRTWAKPRTVPFRNMLSLMLSVLAQIPYQLSQPFASPLTLIVFLIAPVMCFCSIPLIVADDRKIRRTLELEEISLEKRRIKLHPDR